VRIGVFDAEFPPVFHIESGDTVEIQCVSGRDEVMPEPGSPLESPPELLAILKAYPGVKAGHIVTGPIAIVLPEPFTGSIAAQNIVVEAEGAWSFPPEYANAYGILAPDLRAKVENAIGTTPEQLLAAYALADSCRPVFASLFGPLQDVILTPSSPGKAPVGLHTTGNAIFNRMWTLLHGPNVGIPARFGPSGLAVGVTLVGKRYADARLMAVANAVAPIVDTFAEERKRRLFG
jgi:hypothetical protein